MSEQLIFISERGIEMTRREEREQAFMLIFEKMFTDETIEAIIDKASEARDIEVGNYALKIANKVSVDAEIIDAKFEKYLKRWSKNRISKVSLSILRLAMYELLYENEIPSAAVINEAVELTKKFSTKEDSAFVNGVLGSYVRDLTDDNIGN